MRIQSMLLTKQKTCNASNLKLETYNKTHNPHRSVFTPLHCADVSCIHHRRKRDAIYCTCCLFTLKGTSVTGVVGSHHMVTKRCYQAIRSHDKMICLHMKHVLSLSQLLQLGKRSPTPRSDSET